MKFNPFLFLNNQVVKNPKVVDALSQLFDRSSRITRAILFDIRFFVPIFLIICFDVFFRTENLLIISDFLRTVGFSKESLLHVWTRLLPIDLFLVFLFLEILLDLVVINMIIISLDSVKEKMISKYGPSIIKDRGYNMLASSVGRVALLGCGALTSYCADVVLNHQELKSWEKVQMSENDLAREQGRPPIQHQPPYLNRQIVLTGEVKIHGEITNKNEKA